MKRTVKLLCVTTLFAVPGCSSVQDRSVQFVKWPWTGSYSGLADYAGNVWYPCTVTDVISDELTVIGTSNDGKDIYLLNEEEQIITECEGDQMILYKSTRADTVTADHPYMVGGVELSGEDFAYVVSAMEIIGQEYVIMDHPEAGMRFWNGKSEDELDHKMNGIRRNRCTGYDVLHNDKGSIKIEYTDGSVTDVKVYKLDEHHKDETRMAVSIVKSEDVWTVDAVNEYGKNEEAIIENLYSFGSIVDAYVVPQEASAAEVYPQLTNYSSLKWVLNVPAPNQKKLEKQITDFIWEIRVYNNSDEPIDRIEKIKANVIVSEY